MNKIFGILIIIASLWVGVLMQQEIKPDKTIKTIYLAGGCFWGVEAYFSKLPGVTFTKVGFANGKIENSTNNQTYEPTDNLTYEQVSTGDTGFAETVMVEYNKNIITLKTILYNYFKIVDLTSLNRQGFDTGTQYRSGIYYIDDDDKIIIENAITQEQKKHKEPIVTEVEKLKNFYVAEEYHQKYLEKNPQGYCHIDLSKFKTHKLD